MLDTHGLDKYGGVQTASWRVCKQGGDGV
jgi:hypothetical protein